MKNPISWNSCLWWLVLSVSSLLRWSEELWGGWSSFWMHHPSNSPSIIAAALHMSCVLYWHLKRWIIPIFSGCKWLVHFGGKNITSIFFRAVVSLGYAAHWSLKSKIFLFFAPHLAIQLHKKLLKRGWSHPWIGIWCVFGGEFLLFWSSRVCYSCQSPVVVISVCHQHWILAEQWPSSLILFHHGKNHLCMSVTHWAGDYRRVWFHQH